jgi:hypothetical protein
MSSALVAAGLLAICASAIILLGVATGLDRATPRARHRSPAVGPLTGDNTPGDYGPTRAGAPEPVAGPLEGHHDG